MRARRLLPLGFAIAGLLGGGLLAAKNRLAPSCDVLGAKEKCVWASANGMHFRDIRPFVVYGDGETGPTHVIVYTRFDDEYQKAVIDCNDTSIDYAKETDRRGVDLSDKNVFDRKPWYAPKLSVFLDAVSDRTCER